jgi:hypothetical protein
MRTDVQKVASPAGMRRITPQEMERLRGRNCCSFDSSGETVMIRFGTIGAACLAVALASASPAFAGGNRSGGYHGGGAHFAGGGFRGGGARFAGGGFRGGGFGGAGILPGVAAGVVAGALLGGGPGYYPGYYGGYGPGYYNDSYAYDPGYSTDIDPNVGYINTYDNGYAVRNGFVCQPGTWFRGQDGRNHLCQ